MVPPSALRLCSAAFRIASPEVPSPCACRSKRCASSACNSPAPGGSCRGRAVVRGCRKGGQGPHVPLAAAGAGPRLAVLPRAPASGRLRVRSDVRARSAAGPDRAPYYLRRTAGHLSGALLSRRRAVPAGRRGPSPDVARGLPCDRRRAGGDRSPLLLRTAVSRWGAIRPAWCFSRRILSRGWCGRRDFQAADFSLSSQPSGDGSPGCDWTSSAPSFSKNPTDRSNRRATFSHPASPTCCGPVSALWAGRSPRSATGPSLTSISSR